MADKNKIARLLPDRHPQTDFFVCDIFDAAPKSDTASMEYPLFTLSTKPDYSEVDFSNAGRWVKVAPSKIGRATVHDRDVLIYLISQCMAALNDGQKINQKMKFQAQDMLIATNRETSGDGYKRLQAAFTRLQGTQVETNITTGGNEEWEVFGLIKQAKIIRKSRDGRMKEIEIELSDWVFNAISEKGGDILTVSRQYFRLRKPLERRLYEIARKCCGTKNKKWSFKLDTLREKMGSKSKPSEFRRLLTPIIEDSKHIPDYRFELIDDVVNIYPEEEFTKKFTPNEKPNAIDKMRLKLNTYETAKKFANGWNVYSIEDDWRRMLFEKGGVVPEKPDGSFISYVKWYGATKGDARYA